MSDADIFDLQREVADCKAAIRVLADGMRQLREHVQHIQRNGCPARDTGNSADCACKALGKAGA